MRVSTSLFISAALAGTFLPCAARAQSALPTCQASHLNPATLVHLEVGPAPQAATAAAGTKSFAVDVSLAGNGGKVLGYTRIGLRYRPCGGSRSLGKERRDFLKRWLWGKRAEKVFSLDVHVTPLDVKASKPLLTIKRDSTSSGENWSTDVVNDQILLPYFRVDRSSTISIKASIKSSRTYETSAATKALDVVERASNLINPTTALITESNKQRFNDAANFVDSTINGLLAVAIDEKANSRLGLNQPDREQILAVISVKLPMANNTFESAANPAQQVGQWEIYAEQYRPSMLVDELVDNRVDRRATSVASVLNYLVDNQKTIREALAGSKSLAAARDALVAASDKDATDKARTLCRAIVSEAETLGLAPVDSGAVAWAYLTDLSFAEAKHLKAEAGCDDVEHYPAPTG